MALIGLCRFRDRRVAGVYHQEAGLISDEPLLTLVLLSNSYISRQRMADLDETGKDRLIYSRGPRSFSLAFSTRQ